MSKDEGSDSMRMWGSLLRRLRMAAGITHEALALHVGYSKSLVVCVERGTRMPSGLFVTRADECVHAGGLLEAAARHLSRERYLSWFEEYEEAEKRARALLTYDDHVLHDLIQTEAYARAVLAARSPILGVDEIELQVAARLERQALVTRQTPCAMSFVIEEWVLRRAMGEPAVIKGQLEHLMHLAEQRHITLQIMPAAADTHAGIDGPLSLLELPDHKWLAYLEIQGNGQLVDAPERVSALHERHSMIRSQALTPRDSVALIERLARGPTWASGDERL